MGQRQSVECPLRERRLFFARDGAGWNNVRLMFESLVCAARLLGRRLMLPPPSAIAHVGVFHELQVYDAPSVARAVPFGTCGAAVGANYRGSLRSLLRDEAAEELWDLAVDAGATRLQHFECLGVSGGAAEAAARAVLELEVAAPYEAAAAALLARAGLEPGAYHSLHLRRGDFASFQPRTQWSGAELAGRVRSALPADALALVVASDDASGVVARLALALDRRVLRTEALYENGAGALHRAVVDSLVLAKAARFVGTPLSTFSNGVWHLRARSRVLLGARAEAPVGLDGAPEGHDVARGECWQRCTSFGALF